MRARRQLLRGVRVAGICAAVLVLTVASASATVTDNSTSTTVDVLSDADSDTMNLSCSGGGKVHVEPLGTDLAQFCNQTTSIIVSGNAGNDSIDLSALVAANFPQLTEVSLSGGPDTDTIKGSFFGDAITSDSSDLVLGFGGDDRIDGGGTIFGGDDNDTVTNGNGSVDLGPGDDLMSAPAGLGPWSGGSGEDTLNWDLSIAGSVNINFAVTDGTFHIDAPVPPTVVDVPSSQFEVYDITLLPGATQMFNSSTFSGSVIVNGLGGVDKMVAGPGDDFLEGGAGNDELTGGGGFDFMKGSAGDDTVFAQDGLVDRVSCGDGNDTVVADAGDLLTGCESVQLPPTPPPPPPPPPPAGGAGNRSGQRPQVGRAGRQGEVHVHVRHRGRDVPVQGGQQGLEGLQVALQGRYQEPEGEQGRRQARAQGACRPCRDRRRNTGEEDVQSQEAEGLTKRQGLTRG